jgi:putative spermidine/putrescine transport system ATP-binding protein
MAYLDIHQLNKQFGATSVVQDFGMNIRQGEFVTLLGPSGCGKSTVLRMVAGFETPTSGAIHIDGMDMTSVSPRKRGVGIVFQNYALFPNMTVQQNIAFGLKVRRCTDSEIRRKVGEMIELVELAGKERFFPHELSGGQRQRVALARALVVEPRVLLLDEPLSALDERIRKSLREQLRDIQRRLGLTTIFVTHDQEEAMTMSDRIFVMNKGHIEQQGSPEDLYTRPATEFVARFIGNYNLLGTQESHALLGIPVTGHLAIRPESIRIFPHDSGEPGGISGTIRHYQLLGSVIRYRVDCGDIALHVDTLNRNAADLLNAGSAVRLHIEREDVREVS